MKTFDENIQKTLILEILDDLENDKNERRRRCEIFLIYYDKYPFEIKINELVEYIYFGKKECDYQRKLCAGFLRG